VILFSNRGVPDGTGRESVVSPFESVVTSDEEIPSNVLAVPRESVVLKESIFGEVDSKELEDSSELKDASEEAVLFRNGGLRVDGGENCPIGAAVGKVELVASENWGLGKTTDDFDEAVGSSELVEFDIWRGGAVAGEFED